MEALNEAKLNRSAKTNKIEELKGLKTPMEVFASLEDICSGKLAMSEADSTFFFKCFGLFLKDDGRFMLRIRIPAGQLSCEGAAKIGEIAKIYGQNYIDITTRQQIELRFLELKDLATIIKELDSVGVSTFQTGIDNFRNIVTSSFDGLGSQNIIECKPIIDAMQSIFFKKEEWIGSLPRKFNTAILGTYVNDCNIYGHDCSFVVAKKNGIVGFNLFLGGKVGIQGQDADVFVKPDEVLEVYQAVINLFKEYGFRDNRNKNRLHFLLEAVGIDKFCKAIKEYCNKDFESSGEILATEEFCFDRFGIFELDEKISAVNFAVPSGIFSGEDMIAVANLATFTSSKIRLSVEQSFYLICDKTKVELIKTSKLFKSYQTYQNIYFANQIACAGTATCAFGVIPNKPDAINLANYLQKEVPIKDGKVRMYWSGCVKGCGIHGVGDIGFEGCKVKTEDGQTVHGVHIFIGGKATKEAKEARLYKKSVPMSEVGEVVKQLMSYYRDHKLENESFESFDTRILSNKSIDDIISMI